MVLTKLASPLSPHFYVQALILIFGIDNAIETFALFRQPAEAFSKSWEISGSILPQPRREKMFL